jgi:hypothetical protein
VPFEVPEVFGVLGQATLTIQEGAELRFRRDAGIYFEQSALEAIGTMMAPIVLRGTQDDKGWWRGISFASQAGSNPLTHQLDWVEIRNGGSTYWGGVRGDGTNQAGLMIWDRTVIAEISNTTFADNEQTGLYITKPDASVTVETSTFTGNDSAAEIHVEHMSGFDSSNTFGASGDGWSDGQTVLVRDTDIDESATWASDVPFEFVGTTGIVDGAAVTISPGAELRFREDAGIYVSGATLNASGTATDPIVFRGTFDLDSWWRGLSFAMGTMGGGENVLSHVTVSQGGSTYWGGTLGAGTTRANIQTLDRTVVLRLDDVTLERSGGVGLHVEDAQTQILGCANVTINDTPAVTGAHTTLMAACQ